MAVLVLWLLLVVPMLMLLVAVLMLVVAVLVLCLAVLVVVPAVAAVVSVATLSLPVIVGFLVVPRTKFLFKSTDQVVKKFLRPLYFHITSKKFFLLAR